MELVRRNREWQFLGGYYIIACAGDGYAAGLAIDVLVGVAVGLIMALLPVFVMTNMSTRRRIALCVLPVAIALATAFVIRDLVHAYHHTADRWAAIGAVATLATLLIALLTLPLAVIQLVQLAEELSQLTQVSEIERQLNAYSLLGLKLLEPTSARSWFADYQKWIDAGVALIEELADHAEAEAFRLMPMPASGDSKQQLRSRLAYIRETLVPKVRAGYWSDSSA